MLKPVSCWYWAIFRYLHQSSWMQQFKAIDNQFYNLEHYQIKRPGGGVWGGCGGVWGGKKDGIYAAAFSGHLFYDLFSQDWGDHGPLPPPPGFATESLEWKLNDCLWRPSFLWPIFTGPRGTMVPLPPPRPVTAEMREKESLEWGRMYSWALKRQLDGVLGGYSD